MSIKTQNKLRVDFSATSMSDLVFLLLIFFMITSTLVSPNVINLILPKSDSGKQSPARNIEVYINDKKEYFVNPQNTNSMPVCYQSGKSPVPDPLYPAGYQNSESFLHRL